IVKSPLASVERRLLRAGVSARQLRQDGVVKTLATSPTAAQAVLGMVSRGALVTIAAVAIVGFLLAIGGITAVEAARGEPLSSIVADQTATGTTIGNLVPQATVVGIPAPAPTETAAA